MRRSIPPVLAAALFIAAQPQAAEEPRVALVKALGLVEAQRDALDSSARPYYSPAGRFPQLKDCLAGKATDERLAADLAAGLQPSLPSDESVRTLQRFLDGTAGKKLAAGVARRHRLPSSALTESRPGRRPLNFAGVVMFSDELTQAETQDIYGFLTSEDGKPLERILKDTGGFAQLARTLGLMNGYASECGIDLKTPPRKD